MHARSALVALRTDLGDAAHLPTCAKSSTQFQLRQNDENVAHLESYHLLLNEIQWHLCFIRLNEKLVCSLAR